MPLHCWLGSRKGIRSVKSWVLGCCRWRFDWSFSRLIAPVVTTTSIILSSNKIQNRDILVPTYPGCSGRWPLIGCHVFSFLIFLVKCQYHCKLLTGKTSLQNDLNVLMGTLNPTPSRLTLSYSLFHIVLEYWLLNVMFVYVWWSTKWCTYTQNSDCSSIWVISTSSRAVVPHLHQYVTCDQPLPGKQLIEECLAWEPCLVNRTWRMVKDYCRRHQHEKE